MLNYFRIAESRMVAAFSGCAYINGATGPTGPSDTRAAAAVADATSVEDVVEQFNALLANLRAAGLLST